MSDVDTFTLKKLQSGVFHRNLIIPANSLANYLRPFCEPALFHSEGMDEYHLSKAGSVFRLKYKGRYFCFASAHQVEGAHYDYDQLCLLNYDTNNLLTSNRVVFPERPMDGSSNYDCLLFDFSESVTEGRLSNLGWYEPDQFFDGNQTRKPLLACALGYPSFRNEIDYVENRYGASPNIVWGEETRTAMSDRLAFTPNPQIEFDPRGMSGGPVFGITQESNQLFLFFAGILTNATRR
ncbi:MAG: hypothetical protein WA782_15630, partial [Sulfitobacter sp.]